MQRIHQISVKKGKNSKIVFSKVKVVLEQKLEELTTTTNTIVFQSEEQIKIMLNHCILLENISNILTVFSQEKIKVEKLTWKNKSKGPFKRGHLEIIIS